MKTLNSRHIIFLFLGTTIVALKTYPNIIIDLAGRDSWIAVLIASIIIFLFISYALIVLKKTENYSICEIYDFALGKCLSNILLFFVVLTLFLTLVESSSVEASSLHENLLLETPPWYILLFFIGVSLFICTKNIYTLIITTIAGLSFIMVAGFNLGIMTIKFKESKFLFPILANGINSDFLISILKSLGGLSAVFIPLVFFKLISKKNRINLTTSVFIALIIIIQMQIVSMSGIISTFGPKRSVNIWYPKLIQTQLVGYFGFLESGEFFVMLQLVGGWLIKYIITFFALLIFLKELNFHNKYLPFIISALVYGCSFWITKDIFLFFKYINFYTYASLINFILIPFIVFTVFLVKSKIKNRSSSSDKINIQ